MDKSAQKSVPLVKWGRERALGRKKNENIQTPKE